MAAHVLGSSVSYSTIQAAVNAAPTGGTVTVDAGTYSEQVVIGRSMTIDGVQAGDDARSNVRRESGVESIVTGPKNSSGYTVASFVIDASDVTIDGFTVQGETNQSLSYGAGIVILPGDAGAHILNNIIQNNVSGLFLANNSTTDPAVIQHNVFRSNNNAGANGGRGIYTDGSVNGGHLTNVQIDSNTFYNNRGGSGTTGLEAACAFETLTAGEQTNISITNNTFDSNGKAVLFFNTVGIKFIGNTVTNGQDWYSGIVRFEGNNQNVTIDNNLLYNNTGPAIAIDSKGVAGDNSGFVINYNNIYGNDTHSGKHYGVVFTGTSYDGTLDARYNYWGNATGPSGDGTGTGDSIYGSGQIKTGSYWTTYAGGDGELITPFATTSNGSLDLPYWGVAETDGAKIQAEDFDHGGQGNAYSDSDTTNSGGQYRTFGGVDIETTSDTGGGYDVGWTRAGEWLDYDVNLTAGGNYTMAFRLASAAAGATFHVNVDGTNVSGTVAVPSTGGAQTWQTVNVTGIALTSGAHTIRVQWDTNNTAGSSPNFNWFQLTNTTPIVAPTTPSNFAAAVTSSSTVNLTWTNTATTQTGVQVQRSTDGVTFTTIATTPATATSYADTGLSALTTNYYRVAAVNTGGASAYTATATVTTTPSTTAPTYLSDLTAVSSTTGFGSVMKDQTVKGNTITLRGTTYAKGIGTHAVSQIVYNLNGQFGTFASDVGVDDETNGQGSVDFQVIGDGTVLFDSGVLTGTSPVVHVSLNVAGVKTLTLLATNGIAGDIDYDHSDWAGARLLVATPTLTLPAAPTNLTAVAASSSTVYLSWTNNATNQTGFTVARSTDGTNFTPLTTLGVNITTFTDTTAAAGTAYTYEVLATNAAGSSPASNLASATTLASNAVVTNLSTLTPTSTTVGYATIQDNASIKGNPLTLRGTTYASGIGTHAQSTMVYALNGQYSRFLTDIGIDDETAGQGAVDFQIVGDGVVLFDSGVLTGTSPVVHVNMNVAGVQTLTLNANPGIAGSIDYDHADWAAARLAQNAVTPMMNTTIAYNTDELKKKSTHSVVATVLE